MIPNAKPGKAKKPAKKAKEERSSSSRYVMVTFGKATDALYQDFEAAAKRLGLSRAALARELIRQYLGYPNILNK